MDLSPVCPYMGLHFDTPPALHAAIVTSTSTPASMFTMICFTTSVGALRLYRLVSLARSMIFPNSIVFASKVSSSTALHADILDEWKDDNT